MTEMIYSYLLQIVTALVLMAAAFCARQAKNAYVKYVNTQIKKDVAHSAVMFVEQVFKDMHGQDKLKEALNSASERLNTLGVPFSSDELETLVEAAVGEFNATLEQYDTGAFVEEADSEPETADGGK